MRKAIFEMLADLHIHTTSSDGTYSPSEIVVYAKKKSLSAVGITDHDTVKGIREAEEYGKVIGVEVVPGIEINTDYKHTEVHILGYYIDYTDSTFLAILEHLRNMRFQRIEKMFIKLVKHGLKLSFDDVVGDEPIETIGRPHLAAAIIRAGYADSIGEAFSKYLVQSTPGWVKRYEFSPFDAVKAIRDVKGIPVLAHPALVKDDTLIKELVQFGLMGIEAFHNEHTPETTEHYCRLANDMGLVITGGSDFHGYTDDGRADLGDVTVSYSIVENLKKIKGSL
jgi:predicted metal-dependent phosphoesterase TrpH